MPEANKVASGQATSGSQLLRDLAAKKVTLRRFKDKEAERKALKLCRDALLGGPIEEDQTEEGVQRGARGTIGEGPKQRPFRLDTDEPDTAERLSKLAKEVRQADLTASCRHMNFRSKLERHEVEMTELYKQRLRLPLDITDLPLQEPRSRAIRRWRLQKLDTLADPLRATAPELRRKCLRDIEKLALLG